MPRLARLDIKGIPQHVIQRGNNRQACFSDRQDYEFYLQKLKHYADENKVMVHSYVLMTNHVHLLLTGEVVGAVSRMMQSLGRVYVRHFNQLHQRTGTLWEGRFRSTLVDSERYLLTLSRYIEMNPVRANMVQHPKDYSWSSYSSNALGHYDDLIRPHQCYLDLSLDDTERLSVYRALFNDSLSEMELSDIRASVNKGWVLGGEPFQRKLEKKLGRFIGMRKHGGDRRSAKFRAK